MMAHSINEVKKNILELVCDFFANTNWSKVFGLYDVDYKT